MTCAIKLWKTAEGARSLSGFLFLDRGKPHMFHAAGEAEGFPFSDGWGAGEKDRGKDSLQHRDSGAGGEGVSGGECPGQLRGHPDHV